MHQVQLGLEFTIETPDDATIARRFADRQKELALADAANAPAVNVNRNRNKASRKRARKNGIRA